MRKSSVKTGRSDPFVRQTGHSIAFTAISCASRLWIGLVCATSRRRCSFLDPLRHRRWVGAHLQSPPTTALCAR